jgi:hypothetical protein
MSSATTYEWGYAEKNPEQILRENKEFLKGEMNESIRDIMKIISRHKDKFKHINELVEILEKFRDDFLSSYTLDILRSPMHTQWVNDKMNNFNALLFDVKAFIKLLELEIGEKAYIKALKGIADKVPKECKNLKEEIEKYIEMEKEIEKAKEHMDLESLKKIYYELPVFAKDKEEISNILLREELIKKRKEKMDESIQDVIKLISAHKNKFKNINELVEILKKFRDDFLSSYTLDILRSPMHTQWVNDK